MGSTEKHVNYDLDKVHLSAIWWVTEKHVNADLGLVNLSVIG